MANAGRLTRRASWPIIAGVASVVALAITFGYNLVGGYQAELDKTEQTVSSLARALGEHTKTSIEAVDGVLKATLRHLRLLDQLGVDDHRSVRGVLAAGGDSLNQVESLILFDQDGHVANAGLLGIPATTSVADRAFFRLHRDHSETGMTISEPQRSLVSGTWVITISRRVERDDASFAGVLAADVPVEFLTSTFYRALSVGPHGLVSLFRRDGLILAREPARADLLGTSIAASPLFREQLPKSPAGTYRVRASTDSIERIFGYRILPSLPLVVSVGISVDDALAGWRETLWKFVTIWMFCTATIVLLTIAVVRDAARRSAAEAEVAAARATLSDALEGLNAGVSVYDANDRFVMMTRRMLDFARPVFVKQARPGATYEELTWAIARSGEVPAARGREAEWVSERMADHHKPGGHSEERQVGDTWRLITERRTANGRTTVLISDITAIKEAERKVRESAERIQRLAGNIPGYVFQGRIAPDGTVSLPYISDGAREFYGRSSEELMADPSLIRGAIHVEDLPTVVASTRLSRSKLTPWQEDYRVIGLDGTVRWVTSQARPHLEPDGSIVWDGVVVDITARKQAEAALNEAKGRAERATRAKSRFLATMSHELRTPLNAILGFSDVLANLDRTPSLAHKSAEYAADIHAAGTHLLQLINDLLDLSKAESGQMTLSEAPVEIGGIFERVLRLVSARAAEGQLKLSTAVEPGLPLVQADERKLFQIVLNLVANAVKFTPSRGSVNVSAGRDAGGDLVIAVADTGVGIAAENLALVMVPFARVDDEMTRNIAGTGLGLPIAKQMAELHGGTLSIDSTKDVGTTVRVRFPGARLLGAEPSGSGIRRAG